MTPSPPATQLRRCRDADAAGAHTVAERCLDGRGRSNHRRHTVMPTVRAFALREPSGDHGRTIQVIVRSPTPNVPMTVRLIVGLDQPPSPRERPHPCFRRLSGHGLDQEWTEVGAWNGFHRCQPPCVNRRACVRDPRPHERGSMAHRASNAPVMNSCNATAASSCRPSAVAFRCAPFKQEVRG